MGLEADFDLEEAKRSARRPLDKFNNVAA